MNRRHRATVVLCAALGACAMLALAGCEGPPQAPPAPSATAQGAVTPSETPGDVSPRATAHPPASVPSGQYSITTNATCGMFPLSGQSLVIDGSQASITSPYGVLTGSISRISRGWEVKVRGGPPETGVSLTGTLIPSGALIGWGDYGGVHEGGENGWTCAVDQFTATPGRPDSPESSDSDAPCDGIDVQAAANEALGTPPTLDEKVRLCAGDWMLVVVHRTESENGLLLHRDNGHWAVANRSDVCDTRYFSHATSTTEHRTMDDYIGPVPRPLLLLTCFAD